MKHSSKIFYTALFIILSNFSILAQVSFNKNLVLPDTNRSLSSISDMVFANNKLFAYTAGGIMVFDENLNYLQDIPFPDTVYGKFNPSFYNMRFWADEGNLITVKEAIGDTVLYVVTPKLNVIEIATTPPYSVSIAIPRAADLDSIDPMHGNNLIRYDNVHKRLYWVIHGRSESYNVIGNFHNKSRYLAIYNDSIKDNTDSLILIYQESRPYDGDSLSYNERNIIDLKFNIVNNYFYLAKFGMIDIWSINNNTVQLARRINVNNLVGNDSLYHFKFGKLHYAYHPNLNMHKIIAVPLCYSGSFSHPEKKDKIFVLDGDNINAPVQILNSPNLSILDAAILPQNGDLIISYGPNTNYMVNSNQFSDIAIYHYDTATELFDTAPYLKFSTNHSTNAGSLDINHSFKLLNLNDTEVLITKKDEIVKLIYNSTSNNYSNVQVYSGESNFFMKAIKANNKVYVANLVKNGIELFNNNLTHVKTEYTGFGVFNIESTANGKKLYYYSKSTNASPQVFCFNPVNENMERVDNINKPVGDCLFNPKTGNLMITQNCDNGTQNAAKLLIIDTNTNSIVQSVYLQDQQGNKAQYATEMFLSPDNKLYVAANMLVEPNSRPVIFVLNDTSMQIEKTIEYNSLLTADSAQYYIAHFAYNAHDLKTYITIYPQKASFDPYNAQYNSFMEYSAGSSGLLIKTDNDTSIFSVFSHPLGKIVIPSNNYSQYGGNVFILSDILLIIGDGGEFTNFSLNDLIYSPTNDMLYGFNDEHTGNNNDDRKAIFYKLYYDKSNSNNSQIIKSYIYSIEGQLAAFFFNPYDGLLYAQRKFDRFKLGATPAQLFAFNPENPSQVIPTNLQSNQYMQNRSYYTDLDHCHDYHYYLTNLTTPYINPYNNKIYLPNGGHSNVSVVSFTPDESLLLKPYTGEDSTSFTWVSFPRLTSSNPTVNSVIGGNNIEPNTYPLNYRPDSYLENIPLGDTANIYNYYNGSKWIGGQDLSIINPTLGYKLSLKYNTNPNQDIKRYLHGNVIPPDTSVNQLYANKENWVGYWLYQEQNIFDALGNTIDKLNMIKHQDWTCVKTIHPWTVPAIDPTQQKGVWCCDSDYPIIKYGEMVILKGDSTVYSFKWNLFGNPPSSREDLSPEYYSYHEQEDYKPVTVELDSGDHPLEIGAFTGDSCIGATALAADDTMAVIRSYVENDNDTITFQKYYGTKSTSKHVVDDYYIYNRVYKTWHKGFAINNKNKDRFFVSFKKKKMTKPDATSSSNPILRVYPNPAQDNLTIEYLTGNENIYIELFDIAGKKIMKLNEHQQEGLHESVINTQELKNGIYLLKLSTTNQTGVKRFVIKR